MFPGNHLGFQFRLTMSNRVAKTFVKCKKTYVILSPLVLWMMYITWFCYTLGGLENFFGPPEVVLSNFFFVSVCGVALISSVLCIDEIFHSETCRTICFFSFTVDGSFFLLSLFVILSHYSIFFNQLGNGVLFALYPFTICWGISILLKAAIK